MFDNLSRLCVDLFLKKIGRNLSNKYAIMEKIADNQDSNGVYERKSSYLCS